MSINKRVDKLCYKLYIHLIHMYYNDWTGWRASLNDLKLHHRVKNTVPADEKFTDNICAFTAMHM